DPRRRESPHGRRFAGNSRIFVDDALSMRAWQHIGKRRVKERRRGARSFDPDQEAGTTWFGIQAQSSPARSLVDGVISLANTSTVYVLATAELEPNHIQNRQIR